MKLGRTLLALATIAGAVTSCGPYCRSVEARVLPVMCENSGDRFEGELHFDSAPPFETFLRQQCMPSSAEDRIRQIVDDVDFTAEGVFVVAGPNGIDNSRCIASRELDEAQVCTSGLKVYFRDDYRQVDLGCPSGVWTVAFAMSREDLRAALDAGAESAQ